LRFIQDLTTVAHLAPEQALAQYCLLTLNANAFLYLD
jgi:hypothetical protein